MRERKEELVEECKLTWKNEGEREKVGEKGATMVEE